MSAVLGPITNEMTPKTPANQHELAQLFPMLDNDARARLVDDIRENGVLEPVVFLDGLILDGRNRYYAARELGVPYPRADFIGNDPLAFVISRNLHRRHLTDRQRADIAAKMAKLRKGRPSEENPPIGGITVAKAAEMMEVPIRAVERAKAVHEHAAPELLAAYEAGQVSPSAAAEVASLPAEQQAEIVAKGDDEIIAQAAAIKQRRKEAREAAKAEAEKQAVAIEADLSPEVKALQERQKDFRDKAKSSKVSLPDDIEALRDELAEKDQHIAIIEAENADLKRQLAKFDDMVAEYERGGFENVIAGWAQRNEVLKRQVERESQEKLKNLRSAEYWKKKAIASGANDDVIVDMATGDMTRG